MWTFRIQALKFTFIDHKESVVGRMQLLISDAAYKRTYGVWAAMKDRCHNPANSDYKNYGGRGIFYVDAWHSFDEAVRVRQAWRP